MRFPGGLSLDPAVSANSMKSNRRVGRNVAGYSLAGSPVLKIIRQVKPYAVNEEFPYQYQYCAPSAAAEYFSMAAPAGFLPGYRCFYRLLRPLLTPDSGSKRSQHV